RNCRSALQVWGGSVSSSRHASGQGGRTPWLPARTKDERAPQSVVRRGVQPLSHYFQGSYQPVPMAPLVIQMVLEDVGHVLAVAQFADFFLVNRVGVVLVGLHRL